MECQTGARLTALTHAWAALTRGSPLLTDEEKKLLDLLRKIRDDGEWEELPNIKAVDRRKLMKEVDLVDGELHNLLRQGMGVTQVNRLLYAGGAVVTLRLGLKLCTCKKGKTKKPF